MRDPRPLLVAALIPLLVAIASCGSERSEGRDAFVAWAAENARPLETFDPGAPTADLAPLAEMTGGARIVALGESRHDVHEQFHMKSRIVRYLVEERGFTVLILEEGLPYGIEIDRWVRGGPGDGGEILAGAGGWS